MHLSTLLPLFLLPLASAMPVYQSSSSHPVQRRAPSGRHYPAINQTPPSSMTPASWTAAYQAAKARGAIPGYPVAAPGGTGQYPQGTDVNKVCSWTATKCFGQDDIYEAPANEWAVSFDDGPTEQSEGLYRYLASQNQTSTSFMIGSQITAFPNALQVAKQSNIQMALHTWSHTPLCGLTDEQIVAELGWNMQIILDETGLLPALYRPPQGDVDDRVRAIAREVFGLRAVMWAYDSNDWCLNGQGGSACPGVVPGQDKQSVVDYIYQTIYKKDRSQGVIILEHELTTDSVGIFESYYPNLKAAGWQPHCIAELSNVDEDWYSNAENNGAEADARSDVLPVADSSTSAASSSATSSGAASSSSASSAAPSTSSASQPTSSRSSSSSSSAAAHTTSTASALRASAVASTSGNSAGHGAPLHSAALLLGAGAAYLLL